MENGRRRVIAWAVECNPDTVPFDDWWERARVEFGGDDFVEHFDRNDTVFGRVENWRAHVRLRWQFRRFRSGPQSGCHGHVSSSRLIERSGPFSGTTLSCLLHVNVYGTYHAGDAFDAVW
ncbi:DUF3085 domain-containing protein [Paraburkholderia sp. USG1]|uniref:DUF3085 domain-containing protein n=1 Tax=Paraburkholderia sp. USG1 TaxID=2952268 RepID=UPI0038621D00